MIEILLIFTDTFFLRDESGIQIERNDHPLQPGKYYVVATGEFLYHHFFYNSVVKWYAGFASVNNDPWLIRTISLTTGTRVEAFCDAVRSRDRRCVVTGLEVPTIGSDRRWRGFEAAHVFPLAYEGHWIEHNYDRWITIPPETGGTINSVQNGLLLRSDIHELFDNYDFSINPDVCVFYIFWKNSD
jgi:hypothetical protein